MYYTAHGFIKFNFHSNYKLEHKTRITKNSRTLIGLKLFTHPNTRIYFVPVDSSLYIIIYLYSIAKRRRHLI